MSLRQHQAELAAICDEILSGAPVKQIIASVTPGGGKSKLPVILADKLIPAIADKIVWVAPRNNLKYQGETEFLDPRFPTSRRMRATDGNEADPCRGTDGYLTTYQAIGQSPEPHARFFREHRTILFLDESHHVGDNKKWAEAIAPLRDSAVLVVDASGTLARGDGQKIAGLEYAGSFVDLSDRDHVRVIQYSRSQALGAGAILPIYFEHLDGRAEWETEDGALAEADSLAGEDVGDALFTALRTGYARDLLDLALARWQAYRADVFPTGKLLVVSPSIDLAREYCDHLAARGVRALVATSDDGPAALEAIARFKGEALPTADALVTCQMAYEGMSVPAVSHIACLTHIRSIPWLEQCFARANRTALGKREAFIFAPADARIRAAIASIEAEQVQALAERAEAQEGGSKEGIEGGEGRPTIRPIGSAAYREQGGLFGVNEFPGSLQSVNKPDGGLGPKAAETLLRKEIHKHIETFLAGKRPGSKAAYQRILFGKLKEIVGGKAREACSVDELTAQYAWLKRECPL